MSVSNPPLNGTLQIEPGDPWVEVSVVDAKFRRVKKGLGAFEAELPPGIYKVRFQIGSHVADSLIEVESGKPVVAKPKYNWNGEGYEGVRLHSAAPLPSSLTTHEYFKAGAMQLANSPPVKLGVGSGLQIFVRDPHVDLGGIQTAGLSLLDSVGNLVARLDAPGTYITNHGAPWAGASLALTPGTYRLVLSLPEQVQVEQALVLTEGWCTQLYMIRNKAANRAALPELHSSSVFMTRLSEVQQPQWFNGDDVWMKSFKLVEILRECLMNQRNPIDAATLQEALVGKFQDPMLGILGAHLLRMSPQPNRVRIENVVRQLEGLVPGHPDVVSLRLWLNDGLSRNNQQVTTPPMLACSWELITRASGKAASLVPVSSLSGEIAGRTFSAGPWLAWRSAEEGREIETGLPMVLPEERDRKSSRQSRAMQLRDSNQSSVVDRLVSGYLVESKKWSLLKESGGKRDTYLAEASARLGLPRTVVESALARMANFIWPPAEEAFNRPARASSGRKPFETVEAIEGPALPIVRFSKQHFLVLANGKIDSRGASGTSLHDLDRMFEGFEEENRDVFIVHFHGGLVDQGRALKDASALFKAYDQAGAYSAFFVWQSGAVEAIRNNLPDIWNDTFFKRMLTHLLQIFIAKVEQQGEVRGGLQLPSLQAIQAEVESTSGEPFSSRDARQLEYNSIDSDDMARLEGLLRGDIGLLEDVSAIVTAGPGTKAAGTTAKAPLVDREFAERVRAEASPGTNEATKGLLSMGVVVKAAIAIALRVKQRFDAKRDHGLYPTLVEELLRECYLDRVGKFEWNLMKEDTRDAFGDDQLCGGTAFLDRLEKLKVKPKRLLLIGHSAGAIYICRFLQALKARNIPCQCEVVFLAPACTFELFAQTLDTAGDRISKFRMFTMQDALESADRLVPYIYTRSLLYFISGLLEPDEVDMPLVGMERYLKNEAPYDSDAFKAVREFVKEKNPAGWSKCLEPVGFLTEAEHHGGFALEPKTLASIQHIVGHGFDEN